MRPFGSFVFSVDVLVETTLWNQSQGSKRGVLLAGMHGAHAPSEGGRAAHPQVLQALHERAAVDGVWVVEVIRCRHPHSVITHMVAIMRNTAAFSKTCTQGARSIRALTSYVCELVFCQASVEGVLAEHDDALQSTATE